MRLIRSSFLLTLASPALCLAQASLVMRAEVLSPRHIVLGSPVYVRMTLQNAGDEPLSLRFHPRDHPLYMRIIGPDGAVLPYRGAFVDFLGCEPITLEPRQSLSAMYNSSGNFLFDKPGPYRATVVFHAASCSNGSVTTWSGSIESSVLEFAIDPLPPGEKAAYEATIAFSFGHPGLLAPTKKQAADFLEKFHDSLFAPYVQFALGEERAAYEDYNAALPHFQAVINDPTAPLRGLAAERLKACQEELARKVASGESPPHEIGQPVKGQPAAIP